MPRRRPAARRSWCVQPARRPGRRRRGADAGRASAGSAYGTSAPRRSRRRRWMRLSRLARFVAAPCAAWAAAVAVLGADARLHRAAALVGARRAGRDRRPRPTRSSRPTKTSCDRACRWSSCTRSSVRRSTSTGCRRARALVGARARGGHPDRGGRARGHRRDARAADPAPTGGRPGGRAGRATRPAGRRDAAAPEAAADYLRRALEEGADPA